ncbi:MAG: hypothetical protein A4S14_13460 [Proteobacteria bacterium SG_bin9]|nr:MAG: hypothetical protein A4S14_13460 [Proteobacteria bacterium SG_bin9]
MVGASSWTPVAERLRASGWRVHVPDVLATTDVLPPWRSLPSIYASMLTLDQPPFVVGYSLSTVLAAAVAGHMPVRGLVMVDGEIPADSGSAVPGRETFRKFIATLADADGRLPIWSDWWRDHPGRALTGVDELAKDAAAYAAFERDQPRVSFSWFEDALDLAPWKHIPAGYVQISGFYDKVAGNAEERGWPVVRLNGTHLHPALQPGETAAAIETICNKLG